LFNTDPMTLFPEHPTRPRLAVLSGQAFPEPAEAPWYRQLDALAANLGAEWRMVHTVVPDPRPLDAASRARLGDGLFVPQNPSMHGNDAAHFQQTAAAQRDRLSAALARLVAQPAELLATPEFLEAFGFARWIQAFGADLVLSHGLAEGSLPALVAAHLLELPLVVVLDAAVVPTPYVHLLPLHVEQAQLVLVRAPHVREQVLAQCGPEAAPKIVVVPTGELAPPAVQLRIARMLAAPRAAAALRRGPAADFVTRPPVPPRPAAARPFLLLGAERTGSNLLVGMLQQQPGIACAGELFNPRLIAEGNLDWLPGHAVDAAAMMRLRQQDPAALLERLWGDGAAAGARLVGCKLLYGHGTIDDRILDALVAQRDLAVIHLLRADRLRRWLSLARSRATDAWFASSAAAASAARSRGPIELDAQATATEFVLDELFEARYRALFRTHAVLELDYEDLAARLPATGPRLGALLGHELGALVPRSHKTGARELAPAIADLGALRAAFAGTRWAGLFA
jgi:LPS sulfotransferase NodH